MEGETFVGPDGSDGRRDVSVSGSMVDDEPSEDVGFAAIDGDDLFLAFFFTFFFLGSSSCLLPPAADVALLAEDGPAVAVSSEEASAP